MDSTQQSDFWRDRPVLVTGCSGFLGSWLTMALVDAGASVVGLIRDVVSFSNLRHTGYQERITIVGGDVTDYRLLERVRNEYEIDTVCHLAAQTIVPIANRAPLSTFETNVKGTWTLLEAVRRSPKVSCLVAASSDKAYGVQSELPYREEAPLQGVYPYDVSKSCADLICHAYAVTYALPVTITRCANLYGGGDLNWSRLVPGTIRSLLHGERPVIRSDGTLLRDYLFVQDAVAAYMTLAHRTRTAVDDGGPERGEGGGRLLGEAFNFGSEAPHSVLEMVEAMIAVSDRPELEPVVLSNAPNEIEAQYLDSGKARRMLGWRPRHTLAQGLAETTAWYRDFLTRRAA